MIIGITGRIATGKSTLADCFKNKGVPVFNADSVYSDLYANNESMRNNILEQFGTLEKSEILKIVSDNKQMLNTLNDITHPYVVKEMEIFLNRQKSQNSVLDVPIPIQQGFVDICNLIIVTICNQDVQIDRLKKRYNTDKQDLIKRINMQNSQQEYIKIANIILNTESTEKRDLMLFTDTFINTFLSRQC